MSSLEGKVVAITGASSGIGEATAVAAARAGAAVSLAARRGDRIAELAERIEADGGRALSVETDVTDAAQAEAFIARTTEELGRLDVLINNAGLMLINPFEHADPDEWRRMVEVNVFGVLHCTRAALPGMRERGYGHIVNVSSVAGRRASALFAVYNLTKFGVTGFSEALRQELAGSGIRVTVVEPGAVDTELASHNSEVVKEGAKAMNEKLGKLLESEDIAAAILHAIAAPDHVNVAEILVTPHGQK